MKSRSTSNSDPWDGLRRHTAARIALGRDGTEIAVADGRSLARIALGERRVIDFTVGPATALGYAPTGLLRVLR